MAVSLDSPQSLNRYSYVNNMPLSYFDQKGLCGDTYSDIIDAECDGGTGGQGGGGGGATGGGDGGVAVFGNDEFDAIAGAPGTYTSHDVYGGFHWGFSLGQYGDYYASLRAAQLTDSGSPDSPADRIFVYCNELDITTIACDPPPEAIEGSSVWYSRVNDSFRPGSLAYGVFGPPSAKIWNGANQMVYVGTGVAAVETAIPLGVLEGPAALEAVNETLATTSTGKQALDLGRGVMAGMVPGSGAPPPTPAGIIGYILGKIINHH